MLPNSWTRFAETALSRITRRQLFERGGIFTAAGALASTASTAASAPPQRGLSAPADMYESLGVRTLINARGTVTIVGGSKMLPEVRQAMDHASNQFVQIDELMEAVGKRLGELTGAEWGVVTAGSGAAMTLGTAACVAGGDPDKLARLPDLDGMKDEVVIPSDSRNVYEHSVRCAGVRIIEAATAEAFEAALGPRTAMVMVMARRDTDQGPMSLRNLSAIASRHGVPILVDAAAEGLVVPNPHLERGASMVAYSGGKCIRGPQCAGLLLGKKNLVQAAWIHGAPHHGFARGMKVGREEIMGMLAATEAWMTRDHEAEFATWVSWMEHIAARVDQVPGVSTDLLMPEGRGNHTPRLMIEWDPKRIQLTGFDMEQILWDGEPRIAVSGAGSFLPFPPNLTPNISVTAYTMDAGEEKIIADRLVEVLRNPPDRRKATKPPAADLSGRWDVHLDFLNATGKHTFTLEQSGSDINGTHHGEYIARDLTGSISGNEVVIQSAYQKGVRLSYDFSGSVRGDAMSGDVLLGEYGAARWRAHRHVQQITGADVEKGPAASERRK
ncbi:MAG: hypothetical protein O2968_14635 [Acidobacteria bacterium]|nr:hypothetical protein [Acidobacteriota bacterium]